MRVAATMKGCFLVWSLSTISVAALAEEGADAGGMENSSSSTTHKGGVPQRWWVKNSRSYPYQEDWNKHFELRYSFTGNRGNIDMDKHIGSLDFTLRKGNITSLSKYSINKVNQVKVLNNKDTYGDTQGFMQKFSYDLTDRLSLVGGYKWDRNSIQYVNARRGIFAGVKYALVDKKDFDLGVGVNFGREKSSYMNDDILSIKQYGVYTPPLPADPTNKYAFPGISDFKSNGIFLNQDIQWKITDTVTLTERGHYMAYLEGDDYYYWGIESRLDFKIGKGFSFFVGYDVTYENSDFINIIDAYLESIKKIPQRNLNGKIENMDTVFSTGIQYSF